VRTGQWGLGQTAVVLVMPGPWVIGALANNVWRIGGDAQGHVLNTFTTQPFINFNLPFAWSITSVAGAEQMRFQATLLWPTAAAAAKAKGGRKTDDQE